MSPPDAERPGPNPGSPNRVARTLLATNHTAAVCECWECQLYEAADSALDAIEIVELGRLLIVPDVVVIEAAANGLDLPVATRLIREDGRVAHLFRAPAPTAA